MRGICDEIRSTDKEYCWLPSCICIYDVDQRWPVPARVSVSVSRGGKLQEWSFRINTCASISNNNEYRRLHGSTRHQTSETIAQCRLRRNVSLAKNTKLGNGMLVIHRFIQSKLFRSVIQTMVKPIASSSLYSARLSLLCPLLVEGSNSFLTGTLPFSPCATCTGLGANLGGRIPAPGPDTGVLDSMDAGSGCGAGL